MDQLEPGQAQEVKDSTRNRRLCRREAPTGPRPTAAEGPRLWTEGGDAAQGRLDMTPMNTPTDPGHHQGS